MTRNRHIEGLNAVSYGEQHGTTHGYESNTKTHIVLIKYTAHQDKATERAPMVIAAFQRVEENLC